MIVLLSSGARPRYREDIVRVLALPTSGEVQFRYDRSIVEDAVVAEMERGGIMGAALMCYLQNRNVDEPTVVVPCRFATIARSEIVGSSVILTLAVSKFVKDLDDAGLRATFAGDGATVVPHWVPDQNGQPRLTGNFVFRIGATLAEHETADLTAFESVARALGLYPEFQAEGGSFYTTVALGESRERSDLTPGVMPAPRPLRLERGAYRLRSGRDYVVQVYCYSRDRGHEASGDPLTRLSASSDSDSVNFSDSAVADLDSDYDLKRFHFGTEPKVEDRKATIRLELAGKDGEAAWGDISLPVVFSGSRSTAVLRVALIAVGSAAPGMIAAAKTDLSFGLALVMLMAGTTAGLASVFTSLKR